MSGCIDKEKLKDRIYSGERVNPKEALSLFEWELIELGRAADYRRKLIFPHESVGFPPYPEP